MIIINNIKVSEFYLKNKEICLNSQIEIIKNDLEFCINKISEKINSCDTSEFDALLLSSISDIEKDVKHFKGLLTSIK